MKFNLLSPLPTPEKSSILPTWALPRYAETLECVFNLCLQSLSLSEKKYLTLDENLGNLQNVHVQSVQKTSTNK